MTKKNNETVTSLEHLPELIQIRNQCSLSGENGEEPNRQSVVNWLLEHCDKLQNHGCLDDAQDMPSLLRADKLRSQQLKEVKDQVNKELDHLIDLMEYEDGRVAKGVVQETTANERGSIKTRLRKQKDNGKVKGSNDKQKKKKKKKYS